MRKLSTWRVEEAWLDQARIEHALEKHGIVVDESAEPIGEEVLLRQWYGIAKKAFRE